MVNGLNNALTGAAVTSTTATRRCNLLTICHDECILGHFVVIYRCEESLKSVFSGDLNEK